MKVGPPLVLYHRHVDIFEAAHVCLCPSVFLLLTHCELFLVVCGPYESCLDLCKLEEIKKKLHSGDESRPPFGYLWSTCGYMWGCMFVCPFVFLLLIYLNLICCLWFIWVICGFVQGGGEEDETTHKVFIVSRTEYDDFHDSMIYPLSIVQWQSVTDYHHGIIGHSLFPWLQWPKLSSIHGFWWCNVAHLQGSRDPVYPVSMGRSDLIEPVSMVSVNWLDHSKTLREQNIDPNEILLLRRKFFYSDQNVDARDPVQLNLLYVQVREREGWRERERERVRERERERESLFVGCLTSQQHASVSQGQICSDSCMCCHSEIEAADQRERESVCKYTQWHWTLPLCMSCVWMWMCVCACVFVTEREREGEGEGSGGGERVRWNG